uniref:Protein kinase domain-containing protein n=1 Tax=Amphimedon queenslandica TaxID=400682 RepID=A0A1X7V481_AMPQE
MAAIPSPTTKDYEPAKRSGHSTVIVGDCLYMWGGEKDDHPEKHNIEKERRDSSVVEILHLPTGRWEQKPTTGDPPLGIIGYAAVAIGNEIFYYRGHCSHWNYDDNVLYSLNVDTLKWRKVVPTNPEDGPKRKDEYSMIAVKIEGEDYLIIIKRLSVNIIHYFRIATGQWILPKVTGDVNPRIEYFNLMSVDDTSAILLQDDDNISDNSVYRLTFTKGSVVCARIFNGTASCLSSIYSHRSVLLNSPSGLKLLAIGGSQCETFDINKTNWKEVGVPESVKDRDVHSLSVWNEDTTNTWIIEFGGVWDDTFLSDTPFLNIRYTAGGDISVRTYSLREYQEEMGKRRRPVEQEISQKGERERIMEERHQQEIQQLHFQMEERDQQAREREREMERQLQKRDQQYQEMKRRLQREKERELQEPHPIIHRDISSGNVLLQPTSHMGIGWRAKVSDYGSANLQNLIATTENPGNQIYSAPEAGNPREHSPAMDVFSYGVLLIEMSICAIPQPGNRRQDINSIRRAGLKGLVQRCVMDNYKLRPKMSDIINELTQSVD